MTTTERKLWAAGYERVKSQTGWNYPPMEWLSDGDNLVKFPEDAKLRRILFPEDVMGHPAKCSIYIVRELVEYYSKPGDIVMDVTSGTGTLMVAAQMGRYVTMIEIEEHFHDMQKRGLEMLRIRDPEAAKRVTLLHGDCRLVLPQPANHIIFSPPYADSLKSKPVAESSRYIAGSTYADTQDQYYKDYRNLGRLAAFDYNQAMEKIYNLCWTSLFPGGTITIIIKDQIRDGKRVYLSKWVERVMTQIGFRRIDWWKRQSLGTGYQKLHRAKGNLTCDDEDLIVYQKPV
jgi:DNA modification methylase